MDEILKILSPAMREFLTIAVVLRDTLKAVDEIYNEAGKEILNTWNK